MSQIEDLQGRILSAMQRISTGLDALEPATAAPDPRLADALEEERLANAQLQERLQAIKARHESELETLKREIADQAEAMIRLDTDLQRLRQANQQLRDSNAALRDANQEGVGTPELINAGMQAELDALRAARATEAAETGALLSRLQPLLAAAQETLADASFDEEEA